MGQAAWVCPCPWHFLGANPWTSPFSALGLSSLNCKMGQLCSRGWGEGEGVNAGNALGTGQPQESLRAWALESRNAAFTVN